SVHAAGNERPRVVRVLRSPLLLVPAGLLIVAAILVTYASPYLLSQYRVRRTFQRHDWHHKPLQWSEFQNFTWWGRLKHLHFRLRAGIDQVDIRGDDLLSAFPDRLVHLAGIPGLKTVSLTDGRFTADDFRQLARIRGLQTLVICFRAEV